MTRSRWQYRNAKILLKTVNESRPQKENYYRHCLNVVAFACFAPLRVLDWLRISSFGHLLVKLGLFPGRTRETCEDEQAFAEASDSRRDARMQATMEDANLTWTMDMAFYVLSGGCVYRSSEGEVLVLLPDAIAHLSKYEPLTLLPVQRAVIQNPGKANAISKAVTCAQALWFCMQCITRISQGLAVSLLELNTFSHCISALLIYILWWHKPYDAESQVFVESTSLELQALARRKHVTKEVWVWFRASPSEMRSPGRETRKPDFRTYLIADENGNRLFKEVSIGHDYTSNVQLHASDSPNTTRPKLEIPGTRLYVIPDHSDRSFDTFREDCGFGGWREFWRVWLKLGSPIPVEPPKLHGFWFTHRTVSMLYLDREDTIVDTILGGGPMMIELTIGLIMTVTFAVYGGLHLLAWQYSFSNKTARYVWQASAVITASTGLIIPIQYLYARMATAAFMASRIAHRDPRPGLGPKLKAIVVKSLSLSLKLLCYLFIVLVMASRTILVVESFNALPNSPPSTYIIPTWSAYVPHI